MNNYLAFIILTFTPTLVLANAKNPCTQGLTVISSEPLSQDVLPTSRSGTETETPLEAAAAPSFGSDLSNHPDSQLQKNIAVTSMSNHLYAHEYADALAALAPLLENEPEDRFFLATKAFIHLRLNQPQLAHKPLDKLMELGFISEEIIIMKARALVSTDEANQALTLVDKYSTHFPGSNITRAKAHIYIALGEKPEAYYLFLDLLKNYNISKIDIKRNVILALLLDLQDDALSTATRGMELYPQASSFFELRTLILLTKGQTDEALLFLIENTEKSLIDHQGSSYKRALEVTEHIASGEILTAVDLLTRALENKNLEPKIPYSQDLESLHQSQQSIHIPTANEQTFIQMIVKYLHRKDYGKISRLSDQLLRSYPSSVFGLNSKGRALLELSQPRTAYPYFKKALEIEPKNHLALTLISKALIKLGEPSEAEDFLLQAYEHQPNHPVTLHLLASTSFLLEDYQLTLDYLDKLTQSHDAHPERTSNMRQKARSKLQELGR